MDYGPEIVSFYGGNDGKPTPLISVERFLLHLEMLKYTKSKSKKAF